MRKKIRIGLVLGLLILFASYGLYYWWHGVRYPSTENAYVGGNIIRVASLVSGKITKLYVLNDQYIRNGQPLLTIDPEPFNLALAEARTAFDSAADTGNSDSDDVEQVVARIDTAMEKFQTALDAYDYAAGRFNNLVIDPEKSSTEKDELDRTVREVESARTTLQQNLDQLAAARDKIKKTGAANIRLRQTTAQLHRAILERMNANVLADRTGWTANLEIRPGNVVKTGQPLFAVVEDSDRWVDANFKETDLNRLRVGQPVDITVDMYPDLELKGTIESFSGGSGAVFSTLPPENATGNWVKVTQRFTVRISVDNFPYGRSRPLRIGASAYVTVDTTGVDEE